MKGKGEILTISTEVVLNIKKSLSECYYFELIVSVLYIIYAHMHTHMQSCWSPPLLDSSGRILCGGVMGLH